ncbi:MAG: HAD family phosphatase [Sulfitobacter sp.]
MKPSIVVFDIGAVLVEWHPHLAWSDDLGYPGAKAFIERTKFMPRNARADGGMRFADLAAEIENLADRALFAEYVTRFSRTVQNAVPGTWALLDQLQERGVPLHAITNWSAETWPEGLKAHPRLGEVFGVTVVSGQENIIKPDPRIYQILCQRAAINPSDCVFIDDSPKNIEGARAFGMDAIQFTGAAALEVALIERGLLCALDEHAAGTSHP